MSRSCPPDRAIPSSPEVSERMKRVRRRDTKPELELRRELWHRGLRYRVDRRVLPGLRRKADLVFIGRRVAVFVDGCFWHRCPEHATHPKANAAFWDAKLTRNVERDRETDQRLTEAGWQVVRVWEHEEPGAAADRVCEVVAPAWRTSTRPEPVDDAETPRTTRGPPRL